MVPWFLRSVKTRRGARGVVALDVGTAQLHDRIRNDSRVLVFEQTNARDLRTDMIPEPVDLVVDR